MIIDDPVKTSQDARSPAIQKTHLNNWDEGLRTRLNDLNKSAVILVMTRWHVNDLAGQLLKRAKKDPNADQWEVVCLPALAYTPREREMARQAASRARFGSIGACSWASVVAGKVHPPKSFDYKSQQPLRLLFYWATNASAGGGQLVRERQFQTDE